MSRSVALIEIYPNDGAALTLGKGTDIRTGETIRFAGSVATMLDLATLIQQFNNSPRGDRPVTNVPDEFVVEITPKGTA